MKKNVISRKATKLSITFNAETIGHNVGDTVILERNVFGDWSDGKYRYPVSMLRDTSICSLSVIC